MANRSTTQQIVVLAAIVLMVSYPIFSSIYYSIVANNSDTQETIPLSEEVDSILRPEALQWTLPDEKQRPAADRDAGKDKVYENKKIVWLMATGLAQNRGLVRYDISPQRFTIIADHEFVVSGNMKTKWGKVVAVTARMIHKADSRFSCVGLWVGDEQYIGEKSAPP